jgi:hypothetical protein
MTGNSPCLILHTPAGYAKVPFQFRIYRQQLGKCKMEGSDNHTKKIWIISDGRLSAVKPESFGSSNISGPVREYTLSEVGFYLLNPEPISIYDKLVGCHVTYKKSGYQRFKDSLAKIFRRRSEDSETNDKTVEYISSFHMKAYSFKDAALESHFKKIHQALRPYDSLLRMISSMDAGQIKDLNGICEDIAGNRYRLDLQGSVRDKLNYMTTYLLTHVKITMKKAYLTKGLFELRGFDFKNFDPEKTFRLVRYYNQGEPCFCVLGSDSVPGFIVQETKLVYCLQLFEQSLRTNGKLYESVDLCMKGEARPFKLFFTKQLEFSYSLNHLPRIFRNNYDISKMAPEDKGAIAESLNSQQRVISFNYIPHSLTGDEKMHTNISVMHNVRALEPFRQHFPNLFKEILEQAPNSDAGKFYLLDTIKGSQDE